MTIIYAFDKSGGLIAGDTETGRTSYAFPASHAATKAKLSPQETAIEMMRRENRWGDWRNNQRCVELDKIRMAEIKLLALHGHGVSVLSPQLL